MAMIFKIISRIVKFRQTTRNNKILPSNVIILSYQMKLIKLHELAFSLEMFKSRKAEAARGDREINVELCSIEALY